MVRSTASWGSTSGFVVGAAAATQPSVRTSWMSTWRNVISTRGLAWSPDGREVWFTASQAGEDSALRAVDLAGNVRLILSGLARVIIYDSAPDGRVRLGRETFERRVEALTAHAVALPVAGKPAAAVAGEAP